MNYLLDTCVLSEFTRRRPDEKVVRWLDQIADEKLFLNAITIGEIQHGIQRLPDSSRKSNLLIWMNNGLIERFGKRILSLDTATLILWGNLIARMEKSGHPMPAMDSLIAATALQHHLTIITRNTNDFQPCGVQLSNPWD